jgi:hypothetical protein
MQKKKKAIQSSSNIHAYTHSGISEWATDYQEKEKSSKVQQREQQLSVKHERDSTELQ